MNESVFGQYSVFCVFGSVVGCVVVPFIAKVLQQQSMECMILSAIVVSLTAAHLNKKWSSVNAHSKITIPKEYEKKRIPSASSRKSRSSCNTQSGPVGSVPQESKHEKDYMQQQQQMEHMKIMEVERRNELKRQKKLLKREERLKRKEEENRKKKELEDRYRDVKEKRLKQSKDRQYRHQYNLENIPSYYAEKLHRKDISNIAVKQPYKVYENSSKRNQSDKSYQKSISLDGVIENSNPQTKYRPKPLTIKCSNRTASCSSLSSISSCESSVSPSASSKSAWKPTWRSPGSINSWFKKSKDTVETLGCHSDRQYGSQTDHPVKSYAQSRVGFSHATFNLVSSSLFSVDHKGKQATSEKSIDSENPTTVGQYTLFGPQKKNGGSILNSCTF